MLAVYWLFFILNLVFFQILCSEEKQKGGKIGSSKNTVKPFSGSWQLSGSDGHFSFLTRNLIEFPQVAAQELHWDHSVSNKAYYKVVSRDTVMILFWEKSLKLIKLKKFQ